MIQHTTTRILSKDAFRILALLCLTLATTLPSLATTYYSRSSSNWDVNASWSTTGFGGPAAAGYPGINDTALIGDSYTITLTSNNSCARLTIGQGTSGTLLYSGAGTYSLSVSGDITLMTGAVLQYNSNNTRTHSLLVGGSITNNGTFDLYYDNNDVVNLTLNTASTSVISGGGSWQLNNVTINKTSSTDVVDVIVNSFETAINTLTGTSGTYIHDNAESYPVNNSSSADFTISQNMVFKVPQGSMTFSPNSTRTYLYGSLYVNGGNVYIGNTTGTVGLRYDQVGTNIPYLEISSGTLTVYGGINYNTGAGSDPFSFRMTGGDVLLNSGSTGTNSEVFLVNDVASSVFFMSGGTITIQKHNTNSGNKSPDWNLCGSSGSVTSTSGTIQFGNNATPSGTTFDFIPYANAVQPNFRISGPGAAAISLQPGKSATSDIRLLSLYVEANKTFNIRSIAGQAGNSRNLTLTATYDGTNAFTNHGTFDPQTGTVILGGSSAQTIGGNVSTVFYNLTVSNSAGVWLSKSQNVTNLLTMSSGILTTTSTFILAGTGTANANMGSASSYVNGPMTYTIASNGTSTKNYPLGKPGAYRPAVLSVTHNSAASVAYTGEMINSSAQALNYGLPSTVNSVSGTRYWNFTRDPVANLTGAAITLYYNLNDSVYDRNRVVVVHDDGSSNWVDYGGTATADSIGNITSNNFTSFNTKFTFGFPPSPLPVSLIRFNARKSAQTVQCEWETASEINNDYFDVERSSNGVEFEAIGRIEGAGNSTSLLAYQFVDESPVAGDSYYRLRQTDFDGTTAYSEIVHIFYQLTADDYVLFPNPSNGVVHVMRAGASMEGIRAMVMDVNGKLMPVKEDLSFSKDQLTIDIISAETVQNDFLILYLITPTGPVKEKILVGNN